MLKLLGIIAPFVMGRFFGPHQQQGPNIIEKSVMAYRKILALTLIGLISAFILSAGLILGAISIGQQLDLSGNWHWTNLALAGVWLVGIGLVGFVATFAIGKFWDPNSVSASKRRSVLSFNNSQRAFGGTLSTNGRVSLPEVVGLFLLDILEERQSKRQFSHTNSVGDTDLRYNPRHPQAESSIH